MVFRGKHQGKLPSTSLLTITSLLVGLHLQPYKHAPHIKFCHSVWALPYSMCVLKQLDSSTSKKRIPALKLLSLIKYVISSKPL